MAFAKNLFSEIFPDYLVLSFFSGTKLGLQEDKFTARVKPLSQRPRSLDSPGE